MQKTAVLLILFLIMPAVHCYAEPSGIKTHHPALKHIKTLLRIYTKSFTGWKIKHLKYVH
ncbi:MAG: hypothetical protein JRG74_08525 [Deltaproteobacteria bacterium]|nr:hypothetical protein [Deltaproteobacteria bacterium]